MASKDDIKFSFQLRLPKELVEQVDDRAHKRGLSRNEWYDKMTRWVLENKKEKD